MKELISWTSFKIKILQLYEKQFQENEKTNHRLGDKFAKNNLIKNCYLKYTKDSENPANNLIKK